MADKLPTPEDLLDAAAALPLAPLTPVQQLSALGRLARVAAGSPLKLARAGAEFSSELAQVVVGKSSVAPEPGDRRFSHQAWTDNPLYKRLGQSYLSWRRTVYALIDDLDLDESSAMRARFVAGLGVEAVAPTNTLAGNPEALEEAFRTGGRSLYDGLRHALWDLAHNGGMPSMVDTRPFVLGETIAATPGAVVFRSDVLELIQYTPSTPDVYERPLLVAPPQINKFYILDLAPQRSLVEHALAQGQQVFMISWRNPTAEQREWNLDTYVAAIEQAMDAVLEITGAADLNLMGVCAGGITTAATLGHLAAIGDHRVNAVTFLVTVLDWGAPSTISALTSGPAVAGSLQKSRSAGVLDGGELSRFFAWLRPNDLVWNYWVNNYLLGRNPAAFDVLKWNVDSTNLPAGLHGDFMTISAENALTKPGGIQVLDEKIDLASVIADAYVVGAVTDHITPWEGCYRTVNLLGGPTQFVLSSSGHVQVMVNPPDNPKARYFTNPDRPETAEAWRAGATEQSGTWWIHWTDWLGNRSGERRPAPASLGSTQHRPIEDAPGSYVRA